MFRTTHESNWSDHIFFIIKTNSTLIGCFRCVRLCFEWDIFMVVFGILKFSRLVKLIIPSYRFIVYEHHAGLQNSRLVKPFKLSILIIVFVIDTIHQFPAIIERYRFSILLSFDVVCSVNLIPLLIKFLLDALLYSIHKSNSVE